MISQERSVLVQIFYSTTLENIIPGWINVGDHCSWTGVTCNSDEEVTSLHLENLGLSGAYPSVLSELGSLADLVTSGNALNGTISYDICNMNNIVIMGDEGNCPNAVGTQGCCDTVVPSV